MAALGHPNEQRGRTHRTEPTRPHGGNADDKGAKDQETGQEGERVLRIL